MIIDVNVPKIIFGLLSTRKYLIKMTLHMRLIFGCSKTQIRGKGISAARFHNRFTASNRVYIF